MIFSSVSDLIYSIGHHLFITKQKQKKKKKKKNKPKNRQYQKTKQKKHFLLLSQIFMKLQWLRYT